MYMYIVHICVWIGYLRRHLPGLLPDVSFSLCDDVDDYCAVVHSTVVAAVAAIHGCLLEHKHTNTHAYTFYKYKSKSDQGDEKKKQPTVALHTDTSKTRYIQSQAILKNSTGYSTGLR